MPCCKNTWCGLVCHNSSTSWCLYARMDCMSCLDVRPIWHHFFFILFFDISYIKHVVMYSIVNFLMSIISKIGDQIFVQGSQTLEQSHDNIFVSHEHLQTSKLIRKYFDLVDMVQQIITFLHIACEELAVNVLAAINKDLILWMLQRVFMSPLVLYNSYCAQVGCPPSQEQWWM